MCRSYGEFEGTLRHALLKLKFEGRRTLAKPLGKKLVEAWRGEPLLKDVEGVIAVPLHFWRAWRRGYNQAEEIARIFCHETGLPLWLGVCRRHRQTRPQTELGHDQRLENMKKAFRVMNTERIQGRKILLIDDVCTTGATLDSLARALRQAGARDVRALVVARSVMRTRRDPV